MASEILAVPEEYLEEVIKVIRTGLKHTKVSRSVKSNLTKWCNEEEQYLLEMDEDEDETIRKKR